MNHNKMTIGFVIQTFNDEGECLSQEFMASDEITYELEDGTVISQEDMPFGGDEYFPFDMVQPEQFPPRKQPHKSDKHYPTEP